MPVVNTHANKIRVFSSFEFCFGFLTCFAADFLIETDKSGLNRAILWYNLWYNTICPWPQITVLPYSPSFL